MSDDEEMPARLSGVAETSLWTTYYRAVEGGHPQSVLPDSAAVDLVDRIDFPFEKRFGGEDVSTLAQAQGLRTRRFDEEVHAHLAAHPGGTVVALGEGLETQFWRIDDEDVKWIGLDLPEVIELREEMLPSDPRQRNIAASVLDESWMAEIDAREKLLFTAQGLLMYLRPSDVYGLIRRLAQRFPGSSLVFDGVPLWYSSRTIRGQIVTDSGYHVPEMLWGLGRDERVLLRSGIPGVADVRETRLDRGRGILFGEIVPAVSEIPGARHRLPYPSPIVLTFMRAARMVSAQSARGAGASRSPRA